MNSIDALNAVKESIVAQIDEATKEIEKAEGIIAEQQAIIDDMNGAKEKLEAAISSLGLDIKPAKKPAKKTKTKAKKVEEVVETPVVEEAPVVEPEKEDVIEDVATDVETVVEEPEVQVEETEEKPIVESTVEETIEFADAEEAKKEVVYEEDDSDFWGDWE